MNFVNKISKKKQLSIKVDTYLKKNWSPFKVFLFPLQCKERKEKVFKIQSAKLLSRTLFKRVASTNRNWNSPSILDLVVCAIQLIDELWRCEQFIGGKSTFLMSILAYLLANHQKNTALKYRKFSKCGTQR